MKMYRLHKSGDTYCKKDKYILTKQKAWQVFNEIINECAILTESTRRLTDEEWVNTYEELEDAYKGKENIISIDKEKNIAICKNYDGAIVVIIFEMYIDPDENSENEDDQEYVYLQSDIWTMYEIDVIE